MSIDDQIRRVAREEAEKAAKEVVQEAIAQLPRVDIEEYLTVEQLAVILKKGVSSVYRDAQTGKIPGYRYGDSWRFKLSEIEESCKTRNLHVVDNAA